MRKLRLIGLSGDGRQVVFVDDTGAELTAPADERLRAALRGDRARLGQLEIDMESALRPRDIQARIRAGESPESVAALAQVSVDKIMAYCVPVLAERQYVAQTASRNHVRRRNAEGPAQRLGDVVAERLRGRGIDPAAGAWDAWRRDDGRWAVQVAYQSGESERRAMFVFDVVGRFSLAEDDEARWLTGERQSSSKGPQPREGGRASERRLSAVPSGDALLSLSDHGRLDDQELSDDLTAVVRAVHEMDPPLDEPDVETGVVLSTEAEADTTEVDTAQRVIAEPDTCAAETHDAESDSHALVEQPAPEEAIGQTGSAAPQTEPVPERRRRPSRRASVPSWDEIMFGRSSD